MPPPRPTRPEEAFKASRELYDEMDKENETKAALAGSLSHRKHSGELG